MITEHPRVKFEGEWKDESVLFFLRAHFITNFWWIVSAILALTIPPLFLVLFQIFPNFISFEALSGTLATAVWLFFVFIISFQRFLSWYFNIYILTNKRVVDFDFYSIFSHKVSQATLIKIQDVSFEKKGIFAHFFDFGDIKIQTAAEVPNFVFKSIPDPEDCTKQILELITDFKKGHHGV